MMHKTFIKMVFSASLLGMASSACTPVTSYTGFQAIDNKPAELKIGEDTKSTARAKVGSPSATSTFDDNQWYYVTQVSERVAFFKSRVTSREVVAVTFKQDDERVEAVNVYTLRDGKVISFNGRETPTRGRSLTVLEQLLGNVSRGGVLPRPEVGPGQQPGR